jgi:hypothetical protein
MAFTSTAILGFGTHDQKCFVVYSFTDDQVVAERNISLLFSNEVGIACVANV